MMRHLYEDALAERRRLEDVAQRLDARLELLARTLRVDVTAVEETVRQLVEDALFYRTSLAVVERRIRTAEREGIEDDYDVETVHEDGRLIEVSYVEFDDPPEPWSVIEIPRPYEKLTPQEQDLLRDLQANHDRMTFAPWLPIPPIPPEPSWWGRLWRWVLRV